MAYMFRKNIIHAILMQSISLGERNTKFESKDFILNYDLLHSMHSTKEFRICVLFLHKVKKIYSQLNMYKRAEGF